jgi:hypothetical protein
MKKPNIDTVGAWVAYGALLGLLILIGVQLFGCSSAPHTIAKSAVEIRQNAESSRDRFVSLDVPDGVSEQDRIISLTESVTQALPSIQQKPSELLGTLEYLAVAAMVIGVVVLVWQLGLGSLFRSLFSWVPRRKKSVAKLLDEAVNSSDETTIREAVAALRVMDPDIDAAFRSRHVGKH